MTTDSKSARLPGEAMPRSCHDLLPGETADEPCAVAGFSKTVRLGVAADGSVFCKIEWDGKRLSISGVVGPKANGDCRGSCGQIVGTEIKTPAPGWTQAGIVDFYALWQRWHLNDMRAGCEHQRANWPDTTEKVELVTYRLTSKALAEKNALKRRADEDLKATGQAKLTDDELGIFALPFETKHAPDADGPGSGRYKVQSGQQTAIGWLRWDEHPRGLLGKPCEVCGYKYGTSWLVETVPPGVLDSLRLLPETDKQPAWV